MEDEIEDLVGDVKYTDSQKSVATSNMYSIDFTDSSSEQCNSSGKETYVIEWYDSEDSEKSAPSPEQLCISNEDANPVQANQSRIVNLRTNKINQSTSASFHKCSIAQEIFTQTSKTIIELAESDGINHKSENKTLETQTSFLSIIENTVQYKIQVSAGQISSANNFMCDVLNDSANNYCSITCNELSLLDDDSSKYPTSEIGNKRLDDNKSHSSNESVITTIFDDDFKERKTYDSSFENNEKLISQSDTDIEDDSLCNEDYRNTLPEREEVDDKSDVLESVDNEVSDLYKMLTEKLNLKHDGGAQDHPRRTLTPLTEESTIKKESLMDITPCCDSLINSIRDDKYLLFVNNAGVKVKVLPESGLTNFKLPPIRCIQSSPTSPKLNFLFSGTQHSVNDSLIDSEQRTCYKRDRWEFGTKDLASGEGPLINGRNESARRTPDSLQLPPIRGEVHIKHNNGKMTLSEEAKSISSSVERDADSSKQLDSISIKDKITELKLKNNLKHYLQPRTTESRTSRSISPESRPLEECLRLGEIAERGGEALCQELLRRLKSASWYEVADTLEELPKALEKFWGAISENRIADMIRQVSSHIESPRTQVARAACSTVAAILKNTNYTKKPDFYEAVTSLLVKTGSFSRPVRRAANVALDGVVCGVELPHAVTAICVHGASHKSPLVRCASARLLVVCCALAGGGRELLRARPPTAACARRHALKSLAALLEDKNADTRKYAERLYSMLRPLGNFEAYYLTDVNVETASRQMKKFDQLLLCGPPVESR